MITYVQHKTRYTYHMVNKASGGKTLCGKSLKFFSHVANPAGITTSMVCLNCAETNSANKRARMAVDKTKKPRVNRGIGDVPSIVFSLYLGLVILFYRK